MSFLFAIALIGCADEYSPEIGYNYDEVQQIITESSRVDTLYISNSGNDTIVISKIDTVYLGDSADVTSHDTLYIYSRDTVNSTSRDTIVVSKLDTVFVSRTDTLRVVSKDTIIVKDSVLLGTVDTIYKQDIPVGEKMRDSSILLSMESEDGSYVSKTFYGKVYKNVFYDTTLYEYAKYRKGIPSNDSYTSVTYSSPLFEIGSLFTKVYQPSATKYTTLYTYVNRCGGVGELIYDDNWAKYETYNNFPGWRMVNKDDLMRLGDEKKALVPVDALLFVDWAKYQYSTSSSYVNPLFLANVVTLDGNSVVDVTEKDVHYMCAYDLNP